MKGLLVIALFGALVLWTGCAQEPTPTGVPEASTALATPIANTPTTTAVLSTPTSSPTFQPKPTLSSALGIAELKFRLIAQFGDPFYCDPDQFPVAREVTDEQVQFRVAEIMKDEQLYQTILLHLGLSGQAALSQEGKRSVYDESKKLNAISIQPAGDKFQFSFRIPANQRNGTLIDGLIDASGDISVTKKQPSFNICPICLAVDSLIATPNGEVRVQDLQAGMPIWTADPSGIRRAAVVLATVKRDLPDTVTLVDLALEDGRELLASPGHPLTDRRTVGDLARGDVVDGARVARVEEVPYQQKATYDILPSGATGFYWANGILLKSTLAP